MVRAGQRSFEARGWPSKCFQVIITEMSSALLLFSVFKCVISTRVSFYHCNKCDERGPPSMMGLK